MRKEITSWTGNEVILRGGVSLILFLWRRFDTHDLFVSWNDIQYHISKYLPSVSVYSLAQMCSLNKSCKNLQLKHVCVYLSLRETEQKPNRGWIVWTNSSFSVPHGATVAHVLLAHGLQNILRLFGDFFFSWAGGKRERLLASAPPSMSAMNGKLKRGSQARWLRSILFPLNLSKRKNGKPFALHNQLSVRDFIALIVIQMTLLQLAEFPCRYRVVAEWQSSLSPCR